MKPGMQRDILVALWLLFDEFEIGSDDPVPETGNNPNRKEPAVPAKETGKTKPRMNAGKSRRHS